MRRQDKWRISQRSPRTGARLDAVTAADCSPTAGSGLYVQFGCGPTSAPEGWINFDISPTLRLQRLPLLAFVGRQVGPIFPPSARVGDIRRGLPIPASSCAGMYSSHVLEHLSLEDARRAFGYSYMHLHLGGVFRFVLPDLERLVRDYLNSDDDAAALRFMRDARLGREVRPKGLVAWLREWIGNTAHLWMWDFKSIARELDNAGFVGIRRAQFGDSADPRFKEVEDKGRWDSCLGVECQRPPAQRRDGVASVSARDIVIPGELT